MNKQFVTALIIAMIISGFIGFVAGTSYGISLVIQRAVKILPYFTDIKINEDAVRDALFLYSSQIAGCNWNNAPLYNNSGN